MEPSGLARMRCHDLPSWMPSFRPGHATITLPAGSRVLGVLRTDASQLNRLRNPPAMAETVAETPKWVLVQPQWGLCNRLRAVVAGPLDMNLYAQYDNFHHTELR